MEFLSLTQCKQLMGKSARDLSEEDLLRMRQMLYVLADVITDAYADLGNIDQSTFEPPDDLDALIYGGNDAR